MFQQPDVFQYFRKEADTAGSFRINCWFNCEISHHKRELPVIPITPCINDFSSLDSQQQQHTLCPCWCHIQAFFFFKLVGVLVIYLK